MAGVIDVGLRHCPRLPNGPPAVNGIRDDQVHLWPLPPSDQLRRYARRHVSHRVQMPELRRHPTDA